MKTISAKLFFFLGASVLLLACNKDEGPTPAPSPMPELLTHPVAQVLKGNYWQEKICFTYKDDRPGVDVIKVSRDIHLEFGIDGGRVPINKRLDRFFVNPETGKIHAYQYEKLLVGNWYYQNKYSLEYLDNTHIRICTNDEQGAFYGAAINIDLQVVACTDEEIILDGAIKPYIWQNWDLAERGKSKGIMYLGIRVYWTRIENGSEIYEPSNPLD